MEINDQKFNQLKYFLIDLNYILEQERDSAEKMSKKLPMFNKVAENKWKLLIRLNEIKEALGIQ